MKKSTVFFSGLLLAGCLSLHAQRIDADALQRIVSTVQDQVENLTPKVTPTASNQIKLGGFVRTDVIFASRQNQAGAEGLYTYYPLPKALDAEGRDINAASSANVLALTSRLTATYTGQTVSGIKTRAYVEADFGSNLIGNGAVFRLRQAYMELQWENASLLLGQTWHPLSAAVIPVTLDLNTGSPIRPFNRSPQLRYKYAPGAVSFTLAAVFQHSYLSAGPDGASSKYLRNSSLPDFVAGAEWQVTDQLAWGVMGETKALKPRLSTTGAAGTFKTDETIRTYTGQTWLQYVDGDFTMKAAALYAQNMNDAQMIGGYAVATRDILTGRETYTPTQHLNYWLMLQYGRQLKAGLYAGYLKSLGTLDPVNGEFFGRACNMDSMFRLAPRLYYNVGNLQLAGEVEWDHAVFGANQPGTKGDIVNTHDVDGVKVDVAVMFMF
ncbi:MAG: hypothetical protein IJL64_04595 [Bacteroidales bacterium]|nr:hypothetical protein [Bacteroidales bacterium]